MSEYYCGIGKIPKNKVRGCESICAKQKQIRYYGIKAINPKILLESKTQKQDIQKESFKLKKLEEDANLLIKNIKHEKIIISKTTGKKLEDSKKKLNMLIKKKEPLLKKLKMQNDLINKLRGNKIKGGCMCEENEDKHEKFYELGKEIGDIINKNNDGMLLSALIKGLMKD